MRKRPIITMNADFKTIRVMALRRQILALTGGLGTISRHKDKATVPIPKVAKEQP